MEPLLSVALAVDYPRRPAVVRDVRFTVEPGEIVGLVGESGSGKSTVALAILGLLKFRGGSVSGQIRFRGRDLARLSEREMRQIRGREIGLVLQSPHASLNPALKIRTQLEEAWRAHARGSRQERRAQILRAMRNVSLPADDAFLDRHPRQLSVGQAQRVLIAMSILHGPALLIGDEATSALDVITQAEILKLFAQLNRDMGMAILYISHDLLSVASLCRKVVILHEGQVVDAGPAERIFREPGHEYTRRLIEAIPANPFEQPVPHR